MTVDGGGDPTGTDRLSEATAWYLAGDIGRALAIVDVAVRDVRRSHDSAAVALLELQRSGWLRELGETTAAAESLDVAAAGIEQPAGGEDSSSWALLLQERAAVALAQGHLADAAALMDKAVAAVPASVLRDELEPDLLANRAAARIGQGRLHEAVEDLRRALEMDTGRDDARAMSNDLTMLAMAYEDLGDPETAEAFLLEALEVAKRGGAGAEVDAARLNLAALRSDGPLVSPPSRSARTGRAGDACDVAEAGIRAALDGRLDDAATLLDRSAELHAASGNAAHLVHDRINLALVELDRGRAGAAADHAIEACRLTGKSGSRSLRWAAEHCMGRAHLLRAGEGDAPDRDALEDAYASFARAVDAVEQLRSDIGRAAERETVFLSRETVYDDAVLTAALLGRTEDAFLHSERSRVRSLLDVLGDRGESRMGDLHTPEVVELRARRDELAALLAADDGEDPETLRRELRRVRADLRAHGTLVAAVTGAGLPAVSEMCSALPPRVSAIVYHVAGDHLLTFLLDRGGLRGCHMATLGAPLDGIVADFLEEIDAGDLIPASGNELFDLLISPVRARLGLTDTFVVVPHRQLHHLPFDALWLAADDPAVGGEERFVGHALQLATVPSLSVLHMAAARPRSRRRSADPVVLGDPTGDLPGSRAEATTVAEMLGVNAQMGPPVTRATFLGAHGPVLHLAGHGIHDAGDPLRSGVVLADGVVTVEDMLEDGPRCRLLVLSGCLTGRSATRPGDELVGLTHAALRSGVEAVVATLWETSDDASACFFEWFYCALVNGEPLAKAVRLARTATARDQRFMAPVDWAPFVAIGRHDLRLASPPGASRAAGAVRRSGTALRDRVRRGIGHWTARFDSRPPR